MDCIPFNEIDDEQLTKLTAASDVDNMASTPDALATTQAQSVNLALINSTTASGFKFSPDAKDFTPSSSFGSSSGASLPTTNEILLAPHVQPQISVPYILPGHEGPTGSIHLDEFLQPARLSGLVAQSTPHFDHDILDDDPADLIPSTVMEAVQPPRPEEVVDRLGLKDAVKHKPSFTTKQYHSQPEENSLTSILARANRDRMESDRKLELAEARADELWEEVKRLQCEEQRRIPFAELNQLRVQLEETKQLLSDALERNLLLQRVFYGTEEVSAAKEVISLKAKVLSLENKLGHFHDAGKRLQDLHYWPPKKLNRQLGKSLAANGATAKEELEAMGAEEIFRLREELHEARQENQEEIDRLRSLAERLQRQLDDAYDDNASLRPLVGQVRTLKRTLRKKIVFAAGQMGRKLQDFTRLMDYGRMLMEKNEDLNVENDQLRKELENMKAEKQARERFEAIRAEKQREDDGDKAIDDLINQENAFRQERSQEPPALITTPTPSSSAGSGSSTSPPLHIASTEGTSSE
ncbi:hypothetical protein L207DRAFT_607776 [Hyaloscypha variabilis F]|uniref:Uncharacterized protein n=1 Tax=Hyaloscypha variabilis (strain UAMH 11265 / GT02V1 / F) TaxID=1149755 RepID=A0A2J6R3V8_HYAVF|nr:hypothetical protein L207DRAFT_607776 [Hyaloscypha variabilis F]